MTRNTTLDATALRQLLRQATRSDKAGQQALTRLYHHYDPLIRAALPKRLSPQDAQDLVQDVWTEVVAALRQGRRLRRHEDVVALIQASLREATPGRVRGVSAGRAAQPGAPRKTLWQRLLGWLRWLLPSEES